MQDAQDALVLLGRLRKLGRALPQLLGHSSCLINVHPLLIHSRPVYPAVFSEAAIKYFPHSVI